MTARRRRIVGCASVVGILLIGGIVASLLVGATASSEEVLTVEAVVSISPYVSIEEEHGELVPVHVLVAVTSPTRGGVEQLRDGNLRLIDPIYGPGGPREDEFRALDIEGFANLGGGFYLMDLAPYYNWEGDQYVVRIEVVCPWGRGITVCEIPVTLTSYAVSQDFY